MVEIVCTRGYPGSGKSSWAHTYSLAHDYEVVNRDSVRRMMFGDWWTDVEATESRVITAERALVEGFVNAGRSVIVDAAHLNPAILRAWAHLAYQWRVGFRVVDFDTHVDVCVSRYTKRGEPGGESMIRSLAKRWPVKDWPVVKSRERPKVVPVVERTDLPEAVIVDIDGTLAEMVGRSPYDYSRVYEDQVREPVADLVRLVGEHYRVIVVSGRKDDCEGQTRAWLVDNGIPFDDLLLRPTGAKDRLGDLPDYDVKLALFNEHVRDQYWVRFVLDDRDQVVELWRELGLDCFQVNYGDF